MSKKVDVDKIDAALKRAAERAMSGSRDERAGRLVVRSGESGRLSQKDKPATSSKKR